MISCFWYLTMLSTVPRSVSMTWTLVALLLPDRLPTALPAISGKALEGTSKQHELPSRVWQLLALSLHHAQHH